MGRYVQILRTVSGTSQPFSRSEVDRALREMNGCLAFLPGSENTQLYMPALGDEREVIVCEDEELWAKNPGEPLVEAMIELAGHLGARVRNDDFETLRSLTDSYLHPDDRAERDAAAAAAAGRGRMLPRGRKVATGVKLLFLGVVLVTALVRHFQGAS